MCFESPSDVPVVSIGALWFSRDAHTWERALDQYWELVKPKNLDLERELDVLDLSLVRGRDALGWYDFLHDKYFPWKYTTPNRLVTTRARLRSYAEQNALAVLNQIKDRLLALDVEEIGQALETAGEIRGLGTAGASGLLALMYPHAFATVDQFAVRALREVPELPERPALERMNPESLTTKDGVLIIRILRRKADQNNAWFRGGGWTPRKIDKILWTYGGKRHPERIRSRRPGLPN